MTEEFLQYIWKLKLFNTLDLNTVEYEPLSILQPGLYNDDAGPDFFNVRLKIDKTIWVGNIEIHVKASDWYKHKHHQDKAYDNVILHVVYENDQLVHRASGDVIPTLELKGIIDESQFEKYTHFKSNKGWIPCESLVETVSILTLTSTIDKLLLERMERKSLSIIDSLRLNHNNWEETFYQHLARNFGFKVNALAFELLAKSIPLSVFAKHKNNLFQLEALLFGQSGLLNKHFNDDYLNRLQNEYVYLKQKFRLQFIDGHLWKFLRLRPVNFPTIRIAQFAGLIHRSNSLFSKVLESTSLQNLRNLLNVNVSEYWLSHYNFDKNTKTQPKRLGEEAINNIIINTIVPFLFVYGKQKGDEKYVDRALFFLEQLPGEKNTIITHWKAFGMEVGTAYSTQGLMQLKNEYCDHKKCLRCAIGVELIKK